MVLLQQANNNQIADKKIVNYDGSYKNYDTCMLLQKTLLGLIQLVLVQIHPHW